MTSQRQQIKIQSWNCSSIRNKILEFQDFISEIDPDIIALQETRLAPAFHFNLANYTTHRTDRSTHAGGGTAVLIKNSIPHHSTPLQTTIIKGTAITLERSHNSSITIVSAYKSPRKPLLTQDLQNLFSNRRDVLVTGDLNAKYHIWNPLGNNRQGKQLYEYAQKNNLKITAPTQPTRITHRFNNAIIDLCVSKGIDQITAESIPALSSDHNPVLFTINIDDLTRKSINAIHFTNWNKFQLQLKHLLPGNPKSLSY
ncbi:RNA-directed DNA polymerase from mobile element jockey [Nephila pilipes]|uniref:RNA-directed DNA polymerase from mobile element jockey n=1 Tax=Nephila pilipes TaxID=299642 RepID=A0A8X6U0V0_NEPPI|nr:RNA-directed DNA polymerase from mobile element jockey [Nephila pilipes]